jgi:hypothetical protein
VEPLSGEIRERLPWFSDGQNGSVSRLRRPGMGVGFDAAALEAEGGRFAETVDGRTVEYFVDGSTDRRADVVVNMHGSALEARFEMELHEPNSVCAGSRSACPGTAEARPKGGRLGERGSPGRARP